MKLLNKDLITTVIGGILGILIAVGGEAANLTEGDLQRILIGAGVAAQGYFTNRGNSDERQKSAELEL